MIKAVIFDWSGVLSDDLEAVFNSINDRIEEKGGKRISMKKFRELYELPFTRFYRKLGIEMGVEEGYKKWGKAFSKYQHLDKPLPGAKQALEWLKENGIKVIVLSSQSKEMLAKEVQDFGFRELIDYIDASNHDKREKINGLLERNKIAKEQAIYVGDMQHDIETARFAGITSVAVLSGYDSREKLEEKNPDFILNGVGELPKIIEKLSR